MAFGVLTLENIGLSAVGVTPTVLFTAPATADRSYLFVELKFTNILLTNIEYTLTITDTSKSNEVRNVYKDVVLPPGATDPMIDRIVLQPNDILTVTCDTASGLDVNASYAVVTE